jgi:outer membrane protein
MKHMYMTGRTESAPRGTNLSKAFVYPRVCKFLSSLGAVALLGSAGTSPAFAQVQTNQAAAQPPVRRLSLMDAFAAALTNNLDLRIERLNPLIDYQNVEIDLGHYYDPVFYSKNPGYNHTTIGGGLDPQGRPVPATIRDETAFDAGFTGGTPWGMTYDLSGNVSAADIQRPTGEDSDASGGARLTLTQPLLRNLLIDGARYQILIDKNTYKISQQRLQQQFINVLTAVEQAYYDLIFARENVKVQQSGLQLAQRLFQENRRRVEIGKMAPLDEKQAESQVAARQTDLTAAQRTYGTAQNNLKRLLTANYLEVHNEILEPTDAMLAMPYYVDLQESWNKGMALRPDILEGRLNLVAQGITLKYYKNQLLPQLDLNGSYGYGASGSREYSDAFDTLRRANQPNYGVGATFSIPLQNKEARSKYKQGKLQNDQLLLVQKRLEETALVEIDEAAGQIRATFNQVESTRQARIYAEAALDAEQKKLEAGKSTSFVVLQLQRDLTFARSEEIRALAEYNKAQASLAQREGATLQRAKINVNVK